MGKASIALAVTAIKSDGGLAYLIKANGKHVSANTIGHEAIIHLKAGDKLEIEIHEVQQERAYMSARGGGKATKPEQGGKSQELAEGLVQAEKYSAATQQGGPVSEADPVEPAPANTTVVETGAATQTRRSRTP